MKKQTALEWLIEQLENHNGVTRAGFEKCIQQAKEMEKEQIIEAYKADWHPYSDEDAEQYYNETYKNTDK